MDILDKIVINKKEEVEALKLSFPVESLEEGIEKTLNWYKENIK